MTFLRDLLLFGLFWCDLLVILLLTFLPVVVLVVGKAKQGISLLSKLVLCVGPLLVIHLGFLAVVFWRFEHPPPGEIVIDVCPFDDILAWTINWTVPACSLGLLLMGLSSRFRPGTAKMLSGVLLFALAAIATVVCGKRWFGSEWPEYVWWP